MEPKYHAFRRCLDIPPSFSDNIPGCLDLGMLDAKCGHLLLDTTSPTMNAKLVGYWSLEAGSTPKVLHLANIQLKSWSHSCCSQIHVWLNVTSLKKKTHMKPEGHLNIKETSSSSSSSSSSPSSSSNISSFFSWCENPPLERCILIQTFHPAPKNQQPRHTKGKR